MSILILNFSANICKNLYKTSCGQRNFLFLSPLHIRHATQVHDGWNSTNSDLLAIWRRREGAREHKGQFPRGQLCYCCCSKGYFAFYAMSPEEVVLCVQMHTQDGQYFMHSNSKFSINCYLLWILVKSNSNYNQYNIHFKNVLPTTCL